MLVSRECVWHKYNHLLAGLVRFSKADQVRNNYP